MKFGENVWYTSMHQGVPGFCEIRNSSLAGPKRVRLMKNFPFSNFAIYFLRKYWKYRKSLTHFVSPFSPLSDTVQFVGMSCNSVKAYTVSFAFQSLRSPTKAKMFKNSVIFVFRQFMSFIVTYCDNINEVPS